MNNEPKPGDVVPQDDIFQRAPKRCAMCGCNLSYVAMIHKVYLPVPDDENRHRELDVCGRCFVLTSILDKLKEMSDG